MYILDQRLRVRRISTTSHLFNVTNGGKVVSFRLSCFVYNCMDALISDLETSGVGCYMGGEFSGVFSYANDLTILAPNVQ